jgi:hypothetical protein
VWDDRRSLITVRSSLPLILHVHSILVNSFKDTL